jgi:hypothetical protein
MKDSTKTFNKFKKASSGASTIVMIFRFFLQTGEYDFFVRRLKNVIGSQQQQSAPMENVQNPEDSIVANP